ncbi:coproporphyrinogen-III oxidase family protein [Streptomyces sp. NPDC048291]|uniref:coproporphyrinogen-III oxidase family protein n=1 Tax=Streptomyces sp. NPDC048291 TaxID=3365530 RepID=UPI0037139124
MTSEFLFDVTDRGRDAVIDTLMEAENHIPGLVFSYPPISAWQPPQEEPPSPEQLWEGSETFSHNLYIHIPFCRQKCSFCYYSVAVVRDDTDIIWEYLRCLEKEALSHLRVRPGWRVETVFIGGGTPSRLNEDQINFLFERVIGRFDLTDCREITYECSPDSATLGRIRTMAENGVNRLSMGVQTLDPEILRKSRRNDSPDEVLRTYYHMADSGVPNVNIDLIAGIEREAFGNMERTMDAVAGLDPLPTQITLFTLSVREGSINNKTLLRVDDPARMFRRSLTLYRYAKRRMLDMGYWQYSRNLFPRDNWIFHYQDNHWGNNGYVLALGASGYSHSHSHTYLNAFNYREYMRRINNGESAVEKVYPLDEDESLRRHLVLAMKHAELDIRAFESHYPESARPLERFRTAFDALESLGIITRDEDHIRYVPEFADLSDRFVRLFYSDAVNSRIRTATGAPPQSAADRLADGGRSAPAAPKSAFDFVV